MTEKALVHVQMRETDGMVTFDVDEAAFVQVAKDEIQTSDKAGDLNCRNVHGERIVAPFQDDIGFGATMDVLEGNRLIVGAPYFSDANRTQVGAVFIFDELHRVRKTITGPIQGGRFGWNLVRMDFNADGFEDVVVSAPSICPSNPIGYCGRIFVYFGTPTGVHFNTPVSAN
jgi:hypothetical protein